MKTGCAGTSAPASLRHQTQLRNTAIRGHTTEESGMNQPPRPAIAVNHCGQALRSSTVVSHCGQPPWSAVAARQHGLPGVKDHVTAHRHEHRDSARHPASLTGTHPAHKTSVPLLLTKVSSKPHNSHHSGGPAALLPAHSVSATPWPGDSGSQQTDHQRIRSGTSPGRVH